MHSRDDTGIMAFLLDHPQPTIPAHSPGPRTPPKEEAHRVEIRFWSLSSQTKLKLERRYRQTSPSNPRPLYHQPATPPNLRCCKRIIHPNHATTDREKGPKSQFRKMQSDHHGAHPVPLTNVTIPQNPNLQQPKNQQPHLQNLNLTLRSPLRPKFSLLTRIPTLNSPL
ncbi:hypothetical protein M758_2G229600, partial [Ceratodon purpureus]